MSDPKLDALYGPLEAALHSDRILAEERKAATSFLGASINKHVKNKPKPCTFFIAGRCKYQDSCIFSHDPKLLATWKRNGEEAKHEDAAKTRLPIRPGSLVHPKAKTLPCKFFLKAKCLMGNNCTYVHDASLLGSSAHVNRAVAHVPLPALGKRQWVPDEDADAREVRGRYK
jgi:hypothetical protein